MAVYLLHFDEPYKHARHYLGYADDNKLHARIDEHYNATRGDGKCHRLVVVAKEHGISFTLARVWPGADRKKERSLKGRSSTRYCPICRDERQQQREARHG